MLVLAIYIVTFTVGLPANVFVFATLLSTARRRISSSTILLLNLTAADLLLLLFLPFKMVEAAADMTWPLPVVLCPIANYCFYSTIYLSSLFLAALSVERYISVVFPLRYKDRRRPGRAMAASVIIWLLACSHCSIVFIAQYHGSGNWPTTNSSTVIGSDGSKTSNPDGFKSNGFDVSNPTYSTVDSFVHGSLRMSGADDFNPDDFKMSPRDGSVTDGFDPSGSKISSPHTTNGAVSTRNGSRISNPNISTSKTSTHRGADVQALSGSTDASQTSTGPSSSAPNIRDSSNTTNPYKCYDDFSTEQLSFVLPLRLELFLVLFLLPFTVTIFCYINFVRVLLARPNIPLEKKQRAVGLAVATMVNFGVCFAPYNISHVVGFVEKKSPEWRVYALLFNAALDPVIFYFSSTAVQKATAGVVVAVRNKLGGLVGLCYRTRSPGTSQGESDGSLS
ncbi:PREDICTED: free fatty acid receptor 2-like [Fulmarus glacialis]|uniref:free fatty acid receptor 2-like n=1 Tax=Fulmarus glacialis TaxID=30455 RepID=UPI00051B3DA1|nr:PREDICTED: free fatty acid receptor 2-like [Fulmarus glacialis]